jgi:hypothetical protein
MHFFEETKARDQFEASSRYFVEKDGMLQNILKVD